MVYQKSAILFLGCLLGGALLCTGIEISLSDVEAEDGSEKVVQTHTHQSFTIPTDDTEIEPDKIFHTHSKHTITIGNSDVPTITVNLPKDSVEVQPDSSCSATSCAQICAIKLAIAIGKKCKTSIDVDEDYQTILTRKKCGLNQCSEICDAVVDIAVSKKVCKKTSVVVEDESGEDWWISYCTARRCARVCEVEINVAVAKKCKTKIDVDEDEVSTSSRRKCLPKHCTKYCKEDIEIALAKKCKRPKTSTPCPDGWSHFQGSCYKGILPVQGPGYVVGGWGKGFSQAEAQEECAKEGANLVSIHSEAENTFVKDLVMTTARGGWYYFWLGLQTPNVPWTSHQGYWIDKTPVDYANPATAGKGAHPYVPFNPNYGAGENCMQMTSFTSNRYGWERIGGWHDISCEWRGIQNPVNYYTPSAAMCKMPAE